MEHFVLDTVKSSESEQISAAADTQKAPASLMLLEKT